MQKKWPWSDGAKRTVKSSINIYCQQTASQWRNQEPCHTSLNVYCHQIGSWQPFRGQGLRPAKKIKIQQGVMRWRLLFFLVSYPPSKKKKDFKKNYPDACTRLSRSIRSYLSLHAQRIWGSPTLLSSDPHITNLGLPRLLAWALLTGAALESLLSPTGCNQLPSPTALAMTNRNDFLNKGFLRYPNSNRLCLLRLELPPNYDIFLCSPSNIFNIQIFML